MSEPTNIPPRQDAKSPETPAQETPAVTPPAPAKTPEIVPDNVETPPGREVNDPPKRKPGRPPGSRNRQATENPNVAPKFTAAPGNHSPPPPQPETTVTLESGFVAEMIVDGIGTGWDFYIDRRHAAFLAPEHVEEMRLGEKEQKVLAKSLKKYLDENKVEVTPGQAVLAQFGMIFGIKILALERNRAAIIAELRNNQGPQ